MKMLALDTSSVACTVAADIDGELLERHEERPREHTRLLMPMIREVLDEAGIAVADLDAIVLGNGPGSFIGLRIAASVAQGLAHGTGLKIIPVSSLAAVAMEVFSTSDAAEVAVAQDAHMNEVYLGHFGRGEDGSVTPLAEERLQAVEAIAGLDQAGNTSRIAAGFGWLRYPALKDQNRAFFREVSTILYPRASYLFSLAEQGDAIDPVNISPAYLRDKVAEKPGKR